MGTGDVAMTAQPVVTRVPKLVAGAGGQAARRLLEFFSPYSEQEHAGGLRVGRPTSAGSRRGWPATRAQNYPMTGAVT